MDYTGEVYAKLDKYYAKNPKKPKLPVEEVREIISHCNDPKAWISDPYDSRLEVNPLAGQVRNSETRKILGVITSNGYVYVKSGPKDNGNPGLKPVPRGRIILRCAIRDCVGDETVDHKAQDFTYDDRLGNISWAGKKEQIANQRRKRNYNGSHLLEVSTTMDFLEPDRIAIDDAMAKHCLSRQQIRDSVCRSKKGIRMHGFFWRYYISSNPEEIWKPLVSYNGLILKEGYQVSSKGFIRPPQRFGQAPSNGYISNTGYRMISLTMADGTYKRALLHVAVCVAFRGERPTLEHTVDHVDGDITNNAMANLEWATKTEQVRNQKRFKVN